MPEGAQITDGYYRQLTSSVTGVSMVNEGSGYTVANISFSRQTARNASWGLR